MGRWSIHTRTAELVYPVTDDIEAVKPDHKNGVVRLLLKWRRAYSDDDRYKRVPGGKSLALDLEGWQVAEAVEQERKSHTGFCDGEGRGCFDYGKSNSVPQSCLRCRLLGACLEATGEDHRQVRAKIAERDRPGIGKELVLWGMLAIWLLTLTVLARVQSELSEVKAASARVKR